MPYFRAIPVPANVPTPILLSVPIRGLFLAPLIALTLALSGCLESSPPVPEPLPPLGDITSAFRTTAFDDTDYSDLKGFQTMIGDSRIVMMGEQTHGEGSTFAAKARFSRFMHEKMGFDVFILESGFFDMNLAWQRAVAGEITATLIKNSAFYMYDQSSEMRPLFNYIDAHKTGPRPFILSGMDSQHAGELARTYLMKELQAFLTRHGSKRVGTSNWIWAKLQANAFMISFGGKVSDSTRTRYQNYNDSLRADVVAIDAHSPDSLFEQSGFWENILLGLRFQADKARDTTGNARDLQMANNVRWLLEGPYKGKKAVIWTHNVHAFRSFASIRDRTYPDDWTRAKLVGSHLADTYGKQLFVLGATGRQGGYVDWYDMQTKTIPSLDSDFVETKIDTGLTYGFISLRNLPPAEQWLSGINKTCLVDYYPFDAALPELYDGLMYIRTATPTNKPQ